MLLYECEASVRVRVHVHVRVRVRVRVRARANSKRISIYKMQLYPILFGCLDFVSQWKISECEVIISHKDKKK